MNLDRPILVYSNFCVHSKKFIDIAMKSPSLYNGIIRLNIDPDPITRQRNPLFNTLQTFLKGRLTSVPTIVVKNNNDLLVLVDREAFKWLDFHSEKKEKFQEFNPNEMSCFSDEYSNYNSTKITDINDAQQQSFKFLKNSQLAPDYILPDAIPNEDQFQDSRSQRVDVLPSKGNIPKPEQSRSQGHPQGQNIQGPRYTAPVANQSVPKIDFTDPSFGLSGKNNGRSFKAKDLDSKFEELMNTRSINTPLNFLKRE